MELLEISQENLSEIEESILTTSEEKFTDIYTDVEYLLKVMELTKNKQVFLKCMEFVPVPYIVEKLKEKETSQEMLFKLSLHPHSAVQLAILDREDVTPELLKQMIENFKDEKILPTRYNILNHKAMNEETLYELSNYDNNQILSQILLTDKVSRRILKKLQTSNDEEIKTMAKVRDPETDPNYIGKIIRKEFKKTIKSKGDYINNYDITTVTFLLNDTLEAGIRNPALLTELVELYKKSKKPAIISLVIPHPNISKKLLDFYFENGDEEIKEAVSKRNKNEQIHTL